jgi:hypothetical protein
LLGCLIAWQLERERARERERERENGMNETSC